MKYFTFDFETEAIGPRPRQMPPKAVGVSYRLDQGEPEYLAFGYENPTMNNCSRIQVKSLFEMMIADPTVTFVAHNARFDVEVAEKEFGIKIPWDRIMDTLAMAALCYPLAPTLSLKPLTEMVFGMAPDEQSAVRQWLIDHNVVSKFDKRWGAHISKAPVEIVAPYANGDVLRTDKLRTFLDTKIGVEALFPPLAREHQLSPHLIAAEQRGIRVNRDGLANAVRELWALLYRCDAIIKVELNSPSLNVDANDELADALEKAGKSAGFPRTTTGKRSTSKEAMEMAVADPHLRELLKYRGMAATYLRTFAEPWLEASNETGRIYPSWNSVRGEAGGTRTGRLSCVHPNLQNVPGTFSKEMKERHEQLCKKWELSPLPDLRSFLLPEPGHAWISADFNSQELRILAHFAGGKLEKMFNDDPDLDLHELMAGLITVQTGKPISRKATKIIAFSLIYGAGNATMAARLGMQIDEAAALRNAYYDVLPGVRELIDDVKFRARQNRPVRTLGGRQLFAPFDPNGRPKDYALVNYLIQGSAADQTKQTIVDWHSGVKQAVFLTTVHDEINISAPLGYAADAAKYLEACMENGTLKLSVPMRATVTIGGDWGDCSK